MNQETARINVTTLIETSAWVGTPRKAPVHSILIVDDEQPVRQLLKTALAQVSSDIDEAENGLEAMHKLTCKSYDVVLLDIDLPKISGLSVLKQIRASALSPHVKVLILSGHGGGDFLSGTLDAGADDFLTKPCSMTQLRARVASAIRLKTAQERSDQLTSRLARVNEEMERALNARDSELLNARSTMVLALCDLVEKRSRETGAHLKRIQQYCKILAEEASLHPAFCGRLTPELIRSIESAAPLHDIGKVAIPDSILNKPGRLTPDERQVMQTHAAVGAETLSRVIEQSFFATGFFQTAIEIARHHHERWDGTGYPDQLVGEEIPITARIVAIADVYDAMRSPRIYKPGIDHAQTLHEILNASTGHFDPTLLNVLLRVETDFARIFQQHGE